MPLPSILYIYIYFIYLIYVCFNRFLEGEKGELKEVCSFGGLGEGRDFFDFFCGGR